ncbi:MAG: hypothetical protein QXS91_03345 [Candidatus Anstonellales archaeon]
MPSVIIASYLKNFINIDMLEVDNLLDFSCNDECIVLSPHRSKDKKPAITVHIPGNAGKAHFYGMDFMLNISSPYV